MRSINRFNKIVEASYKTAFTTIGSRGTLQSETLKSFSGVSPCNSNIQHAADLLAINVGIVGAFVETAVHEPMLLPDMVRRFIVQEMPSPSKKLIKIK